MSREQREDANRYFYRASALDFMKIPGSPIGYWISNQFLDAFKSGNLLSDYSKGSTGLQTSDSQSFVRYLHEPSASKIGKKWIKLAKGGAFRKWYGNVEHLVNWEDNGTSIKNYVINKYPYLNGNYALVVKNEGTYFSPGILTSRVTSGGLSFRVKESDEIYADACTAIFPEDSEFFLCLLSTKLLQIVKSLNPTINFQASDIEKFPVLELGSKEHIKEIAYSCISLAKADWDLRENTWDFATFPLVKDDHDIQKNYENLRAQWQANTEKMQHLEERNNRLFIEAYGLQEELTPEVPLQEVTLTGNPHYRYGGNRSEEDLETLLQCDTIRELVSYAIGCMMGRYSLDKPGLILASQGETMQDYLTQIPSPSFAPDDDAILPLTDQEWFSDDATNRFQEFVHVVWGDEHLQENLDFVAESLCLHAINSKRGESSLDAIRRYLSTQFFKDHLRTYKKRPIYWLFSSGKFKAFECLVYLHRYNESTLSRMRTEYVIPLTAKMSTYAAKLQNDIDASVNTAEKKRLEKELDTLHKQQAELSTFDEKLRHFADQRISLDLDDGVKVNYGKFGDLLAEVKAVTGDKSE